MAKDFEITLMGEAMKMIRLASGLTATDLAQELDWSQGYVSQIESGQRHPTVRNLKKWCEALGIKFHELVGAEQALMTLIGTSKAKGLALQRKKMAAVIQEI